MKFSLIILLCLIAHPLVAKTASVRDGMIDFAGQMPQGRISLQGNWYSVPKLEESLPSENSRLEAVPGSYSKSIHEQLRSGVGDHTNYLILKNLPADASFGLRFRADTAARVMFGSVGSALKEVGQLGSVSEDMSLRRPEISDKVIMFSSRAAGDYILAIQVQNYFFFDGGIWKAPIIGSYYSIHKWWNQEQSAEIFSLGIIFILTVYNLSLYFYRKEDLSNLYLAGACFFAFWRFVGSCGYLTEIIFSDFHYFQYWMARRLELGTAPLSAAFLASFAVYSFTRGKFAKWIKGLLIFSTIHFGITCLLPDSQLVHSISSNGVMILVASIFVIYSAYRGIRDRIEGATIYLIGMVIFIGTAFHDNFIGLGIIEDSIFLASYGLCFLIFSQGQVVAQAFAKAFRTSEHLTSHLEQEVQAKTRDISTMLDNIPHGILAIYGDGHLGERSRHLEDVLEQDDFSDANLKDTVLLRASLSAEEMSLIENAVYTSIGEDELGFSANEGHLPHEFKMNFGDRTKNIECTWAPVVNDSDEVEKILLVLRDVTHLREMERVSEERKGEMDIIIELVNIPFEKYLIFYHSSLDKLRENRKIIEGNSTLELGSVKKLFVNLHTMKGAARTLGLHTMTGIFHEVEQTYVKLHRNANANWNQTEMLEDQGRLESILEKYNNISINNLGRQANMKNGLFVTRDLLDRQLYLLNHVLNEANPPSHRAISDLRNEIFDLLYVHIDECMKDLIANIERVAKDLNKQVPEVVYTGADVGLNAEGRNLLLNVFTHVIRNSIDHGIEDTYERQAKGKKPAGQISIQVELEEKILNIKYSDDGRGLNLDKIISKTKRRPYFNPDKNYSEDEIANFIFREGISTAEKVTQISGRGVGMGAIKHFLEDVGGDVRLVLGKYLDRSEVPFCLHIKIPEIFFQNMTSHKKKSA